MMKATKISGRAIIIRRWLLSALTVMSRLEASWEPTYSRISVISTAPVALAVRSGMNPKLQSPRAARRSPR